MSNSDTVTKARQVWEGSVLNKALSRSPERKERFRVERRLELSRQGVEKIRRMAGDEIPAAFAETPTGSLEPIQAEELLPFDPDEEDREGLE